MEKNSGFKISRGLLWSAARGVVLGDLLMRCLYRTRPYELVPGTANERRRVWTERSIDALTGKSGKWSYRKVCRDMVKEFDTLPLVEGLRKPRVGVVGEILIKYVSRG